MITLTSDFGLKDPYVAEMKGVILTINPNAKIIDVVHDVAKFDIRMGAFILASAAPYFPKGTVHLAVIDPSVGTERKPILIQTKQAFFVGPDNAVLMLAAQNQGIEHVYQLTNPNLMQPKVSNTFHGRDIFAPAAAHLDLGIKPHTFGAEVGDAIKPRFATVKRKDNLLIGEVLHIDGFGNIITNITEKQAGATKTLNLKFDKVALKIIFAKTYAQSKPNRPVALIGSHGFLEIALNRASAAEKFGVKAGDPVEINL
ncbi:MAG: S-adenosyl-l-methionine hydroxide adenosyltransferase family protein [Ignavibacteria bacterium]